ncbi:MAG: AzlC family ABC transporter permease [Lachnospiraceae bacterium]|jgi:4-azaleucine resistance transporter AzlC|nr:AzlC family ABC transporter permease [Lachnospiraceae bacterium]
MKHAFRRAFPYTIPVLTGYLFIGIAFGVMYSAKGYNFLWAILMSILVFAGSGQYLAVNFFVPGISFLHIIFMELLLNIRHMFYGISLLEKFHRAGKKRWYLIFGLTDETYSLLATTKVPDDVDEDKFLFAITLLNQSYWVLGSGIGALAGDIIPFPTEGIDFAMTALFVVIFVEQWLDKSNRRPAILGLIASFVSLQIFGGDRFVLPSMLIVIFFLFVGRKKFQEAENPNEMDEPTTDNIIEKYNT